MLGKIALTLGLATIAVTCLAPWFEVRMLMFFPALAGLACAGCAWWRKPKDRALPLEVKFALVLNGLAAGIILTLALLFSIFFADRFTAGADSAPHAPPKEKHEPGA